MARALIILLIACAALGLVAGAALHGLALAGWTVPGAGTATLVVRLGLVPVWIAAGIAHACARPGGTRSTPDWLVPLFFYAAFDLLRGVVAAVSGWPIGPVDFWSVWVFLYGACLAGLLDTLRLTRCPAGHPVALDATYCCACRARLDRPAPAAAPASP
jgi:hypothetical protein